MRILDRRSTSAPASTPTSPSSGSISTSGRSRRGPPAASAPASSTPCSRRCRGSPSMAAPTASRADSCAAAARTSGTWLGHVLEHVAIELQNVAGEQVTFGKTRSADRRRAATTSSIEYEQEDVGIEAGNLALTLLHSLLPDGAAARRERAPTISISRTSSTSSSSSPSAAHSGPAPPRWCTPRRRAGFRGSGSTSTA